MNTPVPPKPRALIAILDDEEGLRRALTRLLRAHGYNTVAFASGAELLAGIREVGPDCILLDLSMPEMSGLDVLATLREREVLTPVIAMTGHDDWELVEKAFAMAFDCQRKPVSAPALLAAIGRATERS